MEHRFTRIEERLSALEERLENRLDTRIEGLRTELLSRMDRQFHWTLTLVVMAILVPIVLRLLNV